ncbi:MAG: outer membrane beta-barrel protein [Bacteroidota bacterium]
MPTLLKKTLTFLLLSLCHQPLAANQLGIQISPGISYSKTRTNPDIHHFSSNGSALSLKIGPIYDWAIQHNAYISTGLWWASQHVSVKNAQLGIQEQRKLQYVQVPLLLKLYTEEVILNTELYFTCGAVATCKIGEYITQITQPKPFVQKLSRVGLSGLLGIGVEHHVTFLTTIFVGFSLQLGMRSVFQKQITNLHTAKLLGYPRFISLDLGIKF